MAEKKISQLTAKGAALAQTDLLVVSEDAGGGTYVTKSVTGANIRDPRVQSVTSSATVTATSTNDLVKITAQAAGLRGNSSSGEPTTPQIEAYHRRV